MTTLGLLLAVLVPLTLAAAMGVATLRPLAARLAPWAPLPALVSSLTAARAPAFELDAALLGLILVASAPETRAFLAFTAVLWLLAGLFARTYIGEREHPCSFWLFFLVTMAGNVGAILAGSVATFYVFYAVMTFAAYGLVVHERSVAARRAARTYLAMALGGEMLLVAAFLLVVRDRVDVPFDDVPTRVARSSYRDVICGLLVVGFGVKAGLVPLHLWLPLAHPVAPTPASAVLSGAIIEVALLGWLRFLPLGMAPLLAIGPALVTWGFATALYGAVIGVTQRDAKVVLAYSSISQMGLAVVAAGVGLAAPAAAAAATAAIVFFASHHAIAKGSLFLGAAVAKEARIGWPARLVTLGLLVAALAIAGAPFTSGAIAKIALKGVLTALPRDAGVSIALLSVSAIGSTLLMMRFLSLSTSAAGAVERGPRAGLWVPWLLLLVSGAVLVLCPSLRPEPRDALIGWRALWSSAWPVLAGVALATAASSMSRRLGREAMVVPPGDVLILIEAALRSARRAIEAALRSARRTRRRLRADATRRLRLGRRVARLSARLQHADGRLTDLEKIGALLIGLFAALLFLLVG